MAGSYRLIKWIGDRAVLSPDGWSPASWRYENARRYPMILPPDHTGDTIRCLEKGDHGLSRTYTWDKRSVNQTGHDFVIPVDPKDAAIILQFCGKEFRDVTDHPKPSEVRHEPLIATDEQLAQLQQQARQRVKLIQSRP